MLEQYTVADILHWLIDDKTLVLNPDFQRREIWPSQAKSYLIDTILRGRPMPKFYFRSVTDLKTRRTYREVVDGQQRIRTIQEFQQGEFRLGSRAGDFAGKTYDTLDEATKTDFLTYLLAVETLFNATDDDVLDVFSRLNSFGLSLNEQEKRHGKHINGAIRWAVIDAAKRWAVLWEDLHVVSVRNRVRMADDELMAQFFGVVLDGVTDGGQPAINRLYERYDGEIPPAAAASVDQVTQYLIDNLKGIFETPLARGPHLLLLFAAVAHMLFGIPDGDVPDKETGSKMPARDPKAFTDLPSVRSNLGQLVDVLQLEQEEVPERFFGFKLASAGTLQRIKGRRVRFSYLCRALSPDPL